MPKERDVTRDLARFSGLGVQFAATVGVFAFAGHWLDGRVGSSPAFLIVGVFVGFGLGLYSLIQKVPAATPRKGPPSPDKKT
jgi:F0F1-type ATP synthase assembly protein I